MSVVFPERTSVDAGEDYGLKVLDPDDGSEIFNAKYPIFGSDITNAEPQIITRKITVTNSSGKFSEPATPTISYVADNNWHTMQYKQLDRVLVDSFPHGQAKKPTVMVTGLAHIVEAMRARYYRLDEGSSTPAYNTPYLPDNPTSGNYTFEVSPQINGAEQLTPYHGAFPGDYFEFTYGDGLVDSNYITANDSTIEIEVTDTDINIYMTQSNNLYYQKYHDSTYNFGWSRYEKFWVDYSGSWYQYTFYILPYDGSEDIYIR